MIRVNDLCKFYGRHRGVEGISFEIGHGEVCGLLGLNGAGKTTLLRLLATLLSPTDGQATVAGFDLVTSPEQVRASIGFLPDKPAVYNELSVEKMLEFTAAIRGVSQSNIRSAVGKAMERLDLLPRASDKLGGLSHGFRQRVNLAQALVHKPKVLLLDEPTNGLDPVQIIEMRGLINGLRGEHTVVVSSHLLTELTKICDSYLVVHEGRLVDQGKANQEPTGHQIEIYLGDKSPHVQEIFNNLEGVSNVEFRLSEQGGSYRSESCLFLDCNKDLRQDVFQLVLDNRLDVKKIELMAANSLEQRFVNLVESNNGEHTSR